MYEVGQVWQGYWGFGIGLCGGIETLGEVLMSIQSTFTPIQSTSTRHAYTLKLTTKYTPHKGSRSYGIEGTLT